MEAKHRPQWYQMARTDGAVVHSVAGKAPGPFWIQMYTSTIRFIKWAADLGGRQEPNLRDIAEFLGDEQNLAVLVAVATGNRCNERIAREADQVRLLSVGWRELVPKLRAAIADDIRTAAASNLRLWRQNGAGATEHVLVGERRGAWAGWQTSRLPAEIQEAISEAKTELDWGRGASALRTGAGLGSPVETGSSLQAGRRTPQDYRTLTYAVEETARILRETRARASKLRTELRRRRARSRPPGAEEARLLVAVKEDALSLLAHAAALAAATGAITSEDERRMCQCVTASRDRSVVGE